MTHLDCLDKVRDLVRAHLEEQGAPLDQLQETILIRDGFYCGRRFRCDGHQAIWFIEENELKFYAPEVGVSRVMHPLPAAPVEVRRAA